MLLPSLDAGKGHLDALVAAGVWAAREARTALDSGSLHGTGRERFGLMRAHVGTAEQGACNRFAPAAAPERAA